MGNTTKQHRWRPDSVERMACRDCDCLYPDVGYCPGLENDDDFDKKRERDRLVREVTFTLHPHDNADTLSIAKIVGTDWQCVTRTDQWVEKNTSSECCGSWVDGSLADGVLVGSCSKCGELVCRKNPRTGRDEWLDGESPWTPRDDLREKRPVYHGIYLAIDALLDPSVPDFSFLKPTKKFDDGRPGHRLKTVRLRGKLSQGLLIPIPAATPVAEGLSWADLLKVERYEPPIPADMSGDRIRQPGSFPNYMHIENAKNVPDVFQPGDMVRVTEKIHGTSLKVGLVDDGHDEPVYIVGSHRTSRATDGSSIYPTIARQYFPPELMHRARTNASLAWQAMSGLPLVVPSGRFRNFIVFAEVYGAGVQDLHYGCGKNERRVAVFDVMYNDTYMPYSVIDVVSAMLGVPMVPCLWRGLFDKDKILSLRDGTTTVAGEHVREGVVVTAEPEAFVTDTHSGYSGRKILKYISDDYLERSGAKDGH